MLYSYRIFWVFLLVLSVCLGAKAQQRTEDEARDIAASFFRENPDKCQTAVTYGSGNIGMHRVSAASANDSSPYYIYNTPDSSGFVIVSGDMRMEPVLGYGTDGAVDADNIPESFQFILNAYSDIYEYLQESPENTVRRVSRAKEVTAVEPMLKSLWHQSAPFSSSCVLLGKPCAPGCVTVAIAQILYYWGCKYNYPDKLTGRVEYVCKIGSGMQEYKVDLDLGGYNLDWGQLLPEYVSGMYSGEQKKMIADFMYYVAVSLHTSFNTIAMGSYAYDEDAVFALINYWGMDSGLQLVSKSDIHNETVWNDMLLSELYAGRPVYYAGANPANMNDSHAFVVDGVDNNGYYHVNLGQPSSMSSAYFDLRWHSDEYVYTKDVAMITGITVPAYILDGEMGVAGIGGKVSDDRIHSLTGIPVPESYRGVCVKNGRKIILK